MSQSGSWNSNWKACQIAANFICARSASLSSSSIFYWSQQQQSSAESDSNSNSKNTYLQKLGCKFKILLVMNITIVLMCIQRILLQTNLRLNSASHSNRTGECSRRFQGCISAQSVPVAGQQAVIARGQESNHPIVFAVLAIWTKYSLSTACIESILWH